MAIVMILIEATDVKIYRTTWCNDKCTNLSYILLLRRRNDPSLGKFYRKVVPLYRNKKYASTLLGQSWSCIEYLSVLVAEWLHVLCNTTVQSHTLHTLIVQTLVSTIAAQIIVQPGQVRVRSESGRSWWGMWDKTFIKSRDGQLIASKALVSVHEQLADHSCGPIDVTVRSYK